MKNENGMNAELAKALTLVFVLVLLFILATLVGLGIKFFWVNIILAKMCAC